MQPNSSKKSANLYVGGIPRTWDTKALALAFRPFAEVVSAKVMIDLYTGTSRGFGFVLFESVAVADSVIEAVHGKEIVMNDETVLLRCTPAAFRDQEDHETPNDRIYIRNLPQVIAQDAVFQKFRQFGRITDISIPRNTMSGSAKGVALVRFETIELAQAAKAGSHGQCLFEEDVPLIVRFASAEGAKAPNRGGRTPTIVPAVGVHQNVTVGAQPPMAVYAPQQVQTQAFGQPPVLMAPPAQGGVPMQVLQPTGMVQLPQFQQPQPAPQMAPQYAYMAPQQQYRVVQPTALNTATFMHQAGQPMQPGPGNAVQFVMPTAQLPQGNVQSNAQNMQPFTNLTQYHPTQ